MLSGIKECEIIGVKGIELSALLCDFEELKAGEEGAETIGVERTLPALNRGKTPMTLVEFDRGA